MYYKRLITYLNVCKYHPNISPLRNCVGLTYILKVHYTKSIVKETTGTICDVLLCKSLCTVTCYDQITSVGRLQMCSTFRASLHCEVPLHGHRYSVH